MLKRLDKKIKDWVAERDQRRLRAAEVALSAWRRANFLRWLEEGVAGCDCIDCTYCAEEEFAEFVADLGYLEQDGIAGGFEAFAHAYLTGERVDYRSFVAM